MQSLSISSLTLLAVFAVAIPSGCLPGDGDEEVDGGACADGACSTDGGAVGGDGDGDGDGDGERVTLIAGETTLGFADGVGRGARFQGITCMAVSSDGAYLYVSDTFNGIVRRIDTATGEVVTIGGVALSFSTSDGLGGQVRFTEPRGIGISSDDSTLWIADGPALRSLTVADREAITWAGVPGEPGFVDGDAIDARLGFLIHDIAVEPDGNVLLSDRSNDRIRRWTVADETLATLADGFDGNGGVHLEGSTLTVADTFANVISAVDTTSGDVTLLAGTGAGGSTDGALDMALLDSPQGVARQGQLLYAAGFDGLLRRIDLDQATVDTPVGVDDGSAPADGPFASARLGGAFAPPVLHPDGERLYYADLQIESVRVIDLAAESVSTLAGPVEPIGDTDGPLAQARFGILYGAAATADGQTIYLADPDNAAVRVIDLAAGQVSSLTDDAWTAPVSVAIDEASDELFVVDYSGGRVHRVDLATDTISPLSDETFEGPWGLALADDEVFVADYDGSIVYRVARGDGARTVLAGSGASGDADGVADAATFVGPLDLALDTSTDTLFISDFNGHKLRAVNTSTQETSTLAGTGADGHDDGMPGQLSGPSGIALHDGALFVADTGNHVLRRLDVAAGELQTVLGRPGVPASIGPGAGVPASEATLTAPEALAVTSDGLLVTVEYSVQHVPWSGLTGDE